MHDPDAMPGEPLDLERETKNSFLLRWALTGASQNGDAASAVYGTILAASILIASAGGPGTVFLTMLTSDTVDRFLQCQSVPVRSRCLVALSDGPESVCWHTATQDKAGKGKIEDPNMPSGEFFEKIAGQLAGASSNNVTQEDLDKLWTDFLTLGNPALKAEKDDKTLVLALRG